MKHLKKTLALAMAVACVGCFAACGGDKGGVPGESVKGVQVTAEEWAAAFAATATATNLKVDTYATYEWKAAEGTDFEKGSQTGVLQVADGKMYIEYTTTESWSYTEESSVDTGEETVSNKAYYYTENEMDVGLYYESETKQWTKDEYGMPAEYRNGTYVMRMIEETDYSAYTYNADKGAYVYEETDESASFTVEIKIKGGKIVAIKMTETENDEGVGSETQAMAITYGGASVTIPTDIVIADDAE